MRTDDRHAARGLAHLARSAQVPPRRSRGAAPPGGSWAASATPTRCCRSRPTRSSGWRCRNSCAASGAGLGAPARPAGDEVAVTAGAAYGGARPWRPRCCRHARRRRHAQRRRAAAAAAAARVRGREPGDRAGAAAAQGQRPQEPTTSTVPARHGAGGRERRRQGRQRGRRAARGGRRARRARRARGARRAAGVARQRAPGAQALFSPSPNAIPAARLVVENLARLRRGGPRRGGAGRGAAAGTARSSSSTAARCAAPDGRDKDLRAVVCSCTRSRGGASARPTTRRRGGSRARAALEGVVLGYVLRDGVFKTGRPHCAQRGAAGRRRTRRHVLLAGLALRLVCQHAHARPVTVPSNPEAARESRASWPSRGELRPSASCRSTARPSCAAWRSASRSDATLFAHTTWPVARRPRRQGGGRPARSHAVRRGKPRKRPTRATGRSSNRRRAAAARGGGARGDARTLVSTGQVSRERTEGPSNAKTKTAARARHRAARNATYTASPPLVSVSSEP